MAQCYVITRIYSNCKRGIFVIEYYMWSKFACSIVFTPEAVLEDEDEEKKDAGYECHRSETHELVIHVIFKTSNAGFIRLARSFDRPGVVEHGLFADSSAIVCRLEEFNQVINSWPCCVRRNSLSKLLEFIGRCWWGIFKASRVSHDFAAGPIPLATAASCLEIHRGPGLLLSASEFAWAVLWAHLIIDFDRLVHIQVDGNVRIVTSVTWIRAAAWLNIKILGDSSVEISNARAALIEKNLFADIGSNEGENTDD